MQKFSLRKDPYLAREKVKYPNPLPSREYIISCLSKLGEPVDLAQLCKAFSVKSLESQEALGFRLSAMVRDGQLITNRRGNFIPVDKSLVVRGTVVGHKDGFGFLIPEDGGADIFLTPRQMRTVFPNDRVLVQVINSDHRGRLEGAVIEVLERNTKQIVGRYLLENGAGFVASSNKRITQDLIISHEDKADAKPGQLVVAEIVSYPTSRRQAIGKVVEIIGEHLAPGLEIEVAVRAFDIPHQWSEEVDAEIAKFSTQPRPSDLVGRKDLRHLPFVTIDGEDAKDFDDAVFCENISKAEWRLYVAIADVSHYVMPKTALDLEALRRGNSVYFPGQVVPMLPELLSNGLCSLQPHVDRLSMVCEMNIDLHGKVKCYKFYEGVIRSHARLTYTEVAKMLTEKTGLQHPKLLPNLLDLQSLYQVLNKQRVIRGAISLQTIETKIVFTKKRKIKEILPVEHNVAHVIIEECMLAANVCAAKYLLEKKIPALYRVHEGPTAEKLEALKKFLHGAGLQLTGGDNPTPTDYAKLAAKIKGRPNEHIIQKMLLRSMRQAVYDEENIGHFGLAFEAYGHFTSPIRRYPDLITHRAIKHAISGGVMANFYYDNTNVHNFGEHCSMTERRADDATYDAIDWLKCEFMLDKLGSVFTGVISNVTNFGIFVELQGIFIEGLVHITSLPNDFYSFDPVNYSLVGKRSGRHYRLGDKVKVQVANINLDNREIAFALPKAAKKPKK